VARSQMFIISTIAAIENERAIRKATANKKSET
jgi:hypothetical protein